MHKQLKQELDVIRLAKTCNSYVNNLGSMSLKMNVDRFHQGPQYAHNGLHNLVGQKLA